MTIKPLETPPEIGPLTAGLVHDFNNLLLAMTACLELIRGRSTEARIIDIATHGLSTLDRGTQLVDRLMAVARDRPAAADAAAPETAADPAERQSAILVVDDDADVRLVLVELLRSLGYRLIEAADGPTGIAAADREQPDLAIIDYALPGLNGGEVVAELRRQRPDLPVIFATGYSDPDGLDPRWRHLPILRKPFRIADLARTVAAALRERNRTTSP